VAVSDANGQFVIANVPPTYDLLVLQTPSGGRKIVELYVALTTRQPVVTLASTDATNRSTSVSGTLRPENGFPQPASQRTAVAFSSPGQSHVGSFTVEGAAGPEFGPLSVSWTGTETISGQLYALQWSYDSARIPTGYRAWGRQALSLQNGIPIGGAILMLASATQQEIAGTLRFPQPLRQLNASISVGQISVLSTALPVPVAATSAPYRYLVPTGVGDIDRTLTFHADLTAPGALSSETRARLKDSLTTLDVEVVAPAVHALPVSGATDVDVNTEFAWSPVANAVYSLAVGTTPAQTTFVVYTTGTRAKVPNTLTKGIPLSAGSYAWIVNAVGPARSTDDLVTGRTLLDSNDLAFSTFSTLRTFTAKAP
jgi:hypothetical protein